MVQQNISMWKGNDKYYWSEETITFFKSESESLTREHLEDQVRNFVEDQCQLEEGDTEEKLVKDLISKIYENR